MSFSSKVLSTFAGLMLVVLGLSGCGSAPDYRQAFGALGAGAGAIIDHDNRGRGAAIGAALGWGIGTLGDMHHPRDRTRNNRSDYDRPQYNGNCTYEDTIVGYDYYGTPIYRLREVCP